MGSHSETESWLAEEKCGRRAWTVGSRFIVIDRGSNDVRDPPREQTDFATYVRRTRRIGEARTHRNAEMTLAVAPARARCFIFRGVRSGRLRGAHNLMSTTVRKCFVDRFTAPDQQRKHKGLPEHSGKPPRGARVFCPAGSCVRLCCQAPHRTDSTGNFPRLVILVNRDQYLRD
jgi:hypothetical protein